MLSACERKQTDSGQFDSPESRAGTPWFEECAEDRGIDFIWKSGQEGERYFFPEIMGGGGAFFDLENDGDMDLYLVQGGSLTKPETSPGNQLYRNDGKGHFENITRGSNAGNDGYGMGVAAGDYNNDGLTDLYVTNVGPNILLRNNGDGTFEDVTAAAGVGDAGWGVSAAFFDSDLDGDLDLVLANYIRWSVESEKHCYNQSGGHDYCSPNSYELPARDTLYRNNGDGTFEDISERAGLTTAFGNGLGVVTGDFNGDHWPDIFIANDGQMNQMWINRRNNTFTNEAVAMGCAVDSNGVAKAGMGVDAADIDGDLDLDLIVVNLKDETDSLMRNEGGYFSDDTRRATMAHISRSFTRFGVCFIDFNNDGFLDIYQACGRVMTHFPFQSDDPYAESNVLLRGGPEHRFEEVTPNGGTIQQLIATSRAAVIGDVDNDGGVDVVVVNRDLDTHLLHNIVPTRGHWLGLRVLDDSHRDAIGAVVDLKIGDQTIRRIVKSAYSYTAANDPRIHVGLGTSEDIESVVVHWSVGDREQFVITGIDRYDTIRKGTGVAVGE
jgi:hypothetical protein